MRTKQHTPAIILILFTLLSSLAALAQIPQYSTTMTPANYDTLFTRDIFSDVYLPCAFDFQGTTWNNAQVKFKGHSTRYYPKKSYRVKFSSSNLFQGAAQINFNSMYTDKSFIREQLAWDFFYEMNEMAPLASYAKWSVNNFDKGLYLFVDKVDKYFLQRKGRILAPLYEASDTYISADLTIQPDSILKLYYEKPVGNANDYSDLTALIDTINHVANSSFADVVNNVFDMSTVYNWFAGNTLMMMGDSYNKNYFLYRDTSRATQQWTIIPWDYDLSFGRNGDPALPYPASLLNDDFAYTFPPLSGPSNVLKDRLWNTPALHEQFRLRVDTLLQTIFTEEHMLPRIDSIANLIRAEVARDREKWGTYQDFLDHVDGLKYFIIARRNYLLKTFINPPGGNYNDVTLPVAQTGVPYRFVAYDGRQIATLWFTSMSGLDSIRVQVYPDSTPPRLSDPSALRHVRRWITITPYPSGAVFTAKLQWEYQDFQISAREVGAGVQDERLLRSAYFDGGGWRPLSSTINPFSNVVTLDSINETQCGNGKWFALLLSDTYPRMWYRQMNAYWHRWFDVKFANAALGYIVGEHGTLLCTTDGGTTWTEHHIGINLPFRKLAVRSIDTLFAIGENGLLFRSNDSGTTWSHIDLGTKKNLFDIKFLTQQVGWIVGDSALVVTTTDGGSTWQHVADSAGGAFTSISVFDSSVVIIMADSGRILRTTNNGATWTRTTGPHSILWRASTTFGSSHIVTVGDSGVVVHSTDRGATWVNRTIPSDVTLYGVTIIDTARWFVSGVSGKIFYTTDAGAAWYPQYTAESHDLYAITFTDSSHGIAVGNGGTVLTTTSPGTVTDVRFTSIKIPTEFKLHQNYPNPFNPVTTIVFDLPRQAHVILKVFNLLGQEVTSLLDDELPAGRHHVQWDARDLASGVYFYRIVAAGEDASSASFDTKRMVLIK